MGYAPPILVLKKNQPVVLNSVACGSKLVAREAAVDTPAPQMDSPTEEMDTPALCCAVQARPSAAPPAHRKLQYRLMDTPAAFCDGLPRPMLASPAGNGASKNSAGTFLQSLRILRWAIVTSIHTVGSLLGAVVTFPRAIRTSQRWNWPPKRDVGTALAGMRSAPSTYALNLESTANQSEVVQIYKVSFQRVNVILVGAIQVICHSSTHKYLEGCRSSGICKLVEGPLLLL